MSAKGLKEAGQAIGLAILVGSAIALIVFLISGCAGGRAFVKYEHHSSIPDYYDRATADLLGFCIQAKLGPHRAGDYRPEMEGCVNKEIPGRDNPFGANPSGEISIRVPLHIWQ